MRRVPLALSVAVAVLLTAAPVALAVGAPSATTDPATAIGQTTATLGGTVTPNGLATSWHVEYGTSTSYGSSTPDADAGSGTDAVARSAAVTGLTADTTYHFRLVATNAAGKHEGDDRTLRTAAPPRAPTASTGAPKPGTDRATLTGTVDPRGQDTTYVFQYGTSTRYGSSTPAVPATGSGSRSVSADITGLKPYTTYHVRLVATNATGTTRGRDRAFKTLRAPSGVTVRLDRNVVPWAARVVVSGRVEGQGVGGIAVALERQDFPFLKGFRQEATATASSTGGFKLTSAPLWEATQIRVVTRSPAVVASQVVTVPSALRVGLRGARPVAAGRAEVTGSISPAVPQARASLQRRTATGRWVPVQRAGVEPQAGNRSRYRFEVGRSRRSAIYRVVVVPNDGGAHARGYSRERALRIGAAAGA